MKEGNSPKGQSKVVHLRRNLDKLELELNNINRGIQSYILEQRMNGTWGASRYYDTEEEDGSESDGENIFVFNGTDEDDDAESVLRCPSCDFEIEFSSVRPHLEEMHLDNPKTMFCPVCDEKLGEDAIRFAQNSNEKKRTWKSDKSSISSGDSIVLDKKLPTTGSRHEPVPDPLLSPFVRHMSVQNSSLIHHGEGSSSKQAYICKKGYSETDASWDSCDEQDIEERRLRASFTQELVLSILI